MVSRKIIFYLILGLALAGCSLEPLQPLRPAPTFTGLPPTKIAPTLTLVPTWTPQSTATPLPTATAEPSATPTITPTLAPVQPITRGPYLQDVAPGSIWVVWDTDQASTGWVRFGTTPEMEQVAVEPQSGLHHAIQLTGLAEDAHYEYQVGGDPSPASFHSAPAPGAEKFSFAVLGDTRANPQVHAAIVQRIADSQPGLVLHTGDLVDDGSIAWEWDAFLKIEAPLMRTSPLYPTMGNHESNSPLYFQLFHLPGGGAWYAFDYGDARFIILRVDTYLATLTAAGSAQQAWLESQLAGAAGKWIFVTFHIPLHSSFAEDPSEFMRRNDLAPLFEKYRVTAVFSGHIHSYERVLANGVSYIVTGGGGAPLYSLEVREPGQQAAALVYHYLLFEVDGDSLTGRAIDANGKEFDSFTLTARK